MSKNQLPPKQPNTFIRFSNLAVQMGAIIGLSSWGGVKLDAHFKTQQPYYTIVLSLLGIGIAFYVVLKGLISDSKKKEDEK
jgi:hypothetical protein